MLVLSPRTFADRIFNGFMFYGYLWVMPASDIGWGKTTFAGLSEAGPTAGVRASAGGVASRQPVVVVVEAEAEMLKLKKVEVGTVLCGGKNCEPQ